MREELRQWRWRAAAARRRDLRDIGGGLDKDKTLLLLRSGELEPLEAGILRTLLFGAFATGHRAWSAGLCDEGALDEGERRVAVAFYVHGWERAADA